MSLSTFIYVAFNMHEDSNTYPDAQTIDQLALSLAAQ